MSAPGKAKPILTGSKDNVYNWVDGAPYLTTRHVRTDDIAFIPTGNNHFNKKLGKIGFESSEFRYLSIWVYLLKPEGNLLVQAAIGHPRGWDHRWRIDGRATYQGPYPWPSKGQSANIPVGEWVEIRLDLIEDLGGQPGQVLHGFAFSGTGGEIVYDHVTLIADAS